MEFTLEDVSEDFVKQDPYIKVSIDHTGQLEINARGECRVHYITMLARAMDCLVEELDDDEQEELDAWLDGE